MGSVSTICGMNTLSVQRCMGCRVRDSPKGSLARRYATAFLLESRLIDKLSIRAQLTLHEAEAEKKKKKTRMINVPSVWSVSSFSTHTHTHARTHAHTQAEPQMCLCSRVKNEWTSTPYTNLSGCLHTGSSAHTDTHVHRSPQGYIPEATRRKMSERNSFLG